MKNLLFILIVFCSHNVFGQELKLDTARHKSYSNGDYRIMQIEATDLNLMPLDYTFTYYYTSDGTFECVLPNCERNFKPGVFRIEYYRERVKDGEEIEYYRFEEIVYPYNCNGAFRIKHNGLWKNGKRIGKWKYYSKNGMITTVDYHDKKTGIRSKRINYENGKKKNTVFIKLPMKF